MDSKKERQEAMQELQEIETSLQMILAEKQNIQLESGEVENALSELNQNSTDEVYKILSGIMIKTNKDSLIKDLTEKKKLFDMKLESYNKNIKSFEEKSAKLRKEIIATSK
jgi:prefoldin beta subunit